MAIDVYLLFLLVCCLVVNILQCFVWDNGDNSNRDRMMDRGKGMVNIGWLV